MPRTDIIHGAIKNALVKDGWTITHDPYTIEYEGEKLYADLAAERPFAAERAGAKIVVEVKSFIGPSPIHDFQIALGQYNLYLVYLEKTAPERRLFLAISDQVYDRLFKKAAIKVIVERFRIALLIVDVQAEEVVQWIN
jgi:CRISPR/Cas system-associated exonuclease Cas4 (RecB family)